MANKCVSFLGNGTCDKGHECSCFKLLGLECNDYDPVEEEGDECCMET